MRKLQDCLYPENSRGKCFRKWQKIKKRERIPLLMSEKKMYYSTVTDLARFLG
jgi:hypothetical protein